MTTIIKMRLYVYSILCWVMLALTAIGSERDAETDEPDTMSVVTENLIKELENGEKIELCVWKYYDHNRMLCEIAVQQMNSTTDTYWISDLEILFPRDATDDAGEFAIELFPIKFFGEKRVGDCVIIGLCYSTVLRKEMSSVEGTLNRQPKKTNL